ncbi:hypothetical protein [Streptomyces sp. NPDC006552]|uniref:hypothetical protein n=1 Tax=Streptomyces sp. NPDC006552 TaxID=3157179 RepID=UPI0033B22A01
MAHPYIPAPPPGPPTRPAPKWARKRIVLPALGVAVLLGAGIGAAGDDGKDGSATVATARIRPAPTVTVTATATATATETADPEPAPTVTATKTVKVKVTVTAKAASGSGGGSGGGTSGGSGSSGGGTKAGTCSLTSNAGNCYAAGQFCRNADHGASTTTAGGAAITCRYSGSAWRWTSG